METVMVGALAAVLMTAMWTDLRASRIPNWLTFSAMGFALLVHACLGGLQGAIFGLTGLGAGSLVGSTCSCFSELCCSWVSGAGTVADVTGLTFVCEPLSSTTAR